MCVCSPHHHHLLLKSCIHKPRTTNNTVQSASLPAVQYDVRAGRRGRADTPHPMLAPSQRPTVRRPTAALLLVCRPRRRRPPSLSAAAPSLSWVSPASSSPCCCQVGRPRPCNRHEPGRPARQAAWRAARSPAGSSQAVIPVGAALCAVRQPGACTATPHGVVHGSSWMGGQGARPGSARPWQRRAVCLGRAAWATSRQRRAGRQAPTHKSAPLELPCSLKGSTATGGAPERSIGRRLVSLAFSPAALPPAFPACLPPKPPLQASQPWSCTARGRWHGGWRKQRRSWRKRRRRRRG